MPQGAVSLFNSIDPILQRFTAVPPGTGPAEARALLILKLGLPMGAFVHTTWVPMFFYLDLSILAWWNIVVALMFTVTSVLAHYPGRALDVAFLLCLIEMPLHGILATYFVGVGTVFWIWPVTATTLVFAMITYPWPLRITISMTVAVTTIVCVTWLALLGPQQEISAAWQGFFVGSNLLGGMGQLALLFAIFQRVVESTETNLQREFDRAEGLLRNILPDPIALRLKDGEQLIADEHAEVSVIFADIVGFTAASAKLTPAELVATLNTVFSEFDQLADRHGAEKIKTIGDAFMVVVGVPDDRTSHAEAAVELALEMMQAAQRISGRTHFPIRLRVGVNSGPVVAGVIGTRKFAYDLWGDVVNVASRMEAHCEPGKVLITEKTRALLPDRFQIRSEGTREVKGKGVMPVFSVTQSQARNVSAISN